MRLSCLLLTPAILCGLACSSDSLGVTDQHQVEADLVGSWSQVVTAREDQQVIELTVHDTVVSGVGHWFGEAIVGGNIIVTGHITGSQVDLVLSRDDNSSLRFSGHLASKNSLVGSSNLVDHAVPAQFKRVAVDPP
jgi:hypothetical protein